MTRQHLRFPLFNAIILAIPSALAGYYVSRPLTWIVGGFLVGFCLALFVEFLSVRTGYEGWWYRRRVILFAITQILVMLFLVAPYAYVVQNSLPRNRPVGPPPTDLFGPDDYQDITFAGYDGVTLAGWYVPPPDEHGAVIILLHGSEGIRTDTLRYARLLYEQGYGLLMYDERAHGESGGRRSWGWHDRLDVEYAIDFLVAQPGVDPDRIGGMGLSLGGHILLGSMPFQDGIAAYWLDGLGAQGTPDFPETHHAGEDFALFINQILEALMSVHAGIAQPEPFSAYLSEITRPVMLVAGGLDDFEARVHEKYREIASDSVEVWIIPEAWHVAGFGVRPDEYRQRMLDFFRTHLLDS